jgi:hypothetical protein
LRNFMTGTKGSTMMIWFFFLVHGFMISCLTLMGPDLWPCS